MVAAEPTVRVESIGVQKLAARLAANEAVMADRQELKLVTSACDSRRLPIVEIRLYDSIGAPVVGRIAESALLFGVRTLEDEAGFVAQLTLLAAALEASRLT